MPVMDGIETCREIMELLPDTKVLMLTASNEQDAIVRSISADYLQKYSRKEQFLATLREVAEAEFRIPGDAARRPSRAVRSPSANAAAERLATLTDRGREILKLFAEELTRSRRDAEQQRPDHAQRRVGRPEEVGVQDQAADGGGRCGPAWWKSTGRRWAGPQHRVVLDTNVIVSALNFPGKERLVLESALCGG